MHRIRTLGSVDQYLHDSDDRSAAPDTIRFLADAGIDSGIGPRQASTARSSESGIYWSTDPKDRGPARGTRRRPPARAERPRTRPPTRSPRPPRAGARTIRRAPPARGTRRRARPPPRPSTRLRDRPPRPRAGLGPPPRPSPAAAAGTRATAASSA